MHVISKKKLRDFWLRHPTAETPLRAWDKTARSAHWRSFDDVRSTFRTVDRYKKFLIFDIGGNKFRLIIVANLNRNRLNVRHVLTHREYSGGKWKG